MPIGFDPQDEASFSLRSDVKKYPDEATRPKFFTPFYSAREYGRIRKAATAIFAKIDATDDFEAKTDLQVEAAKLVITRWENVPDHPRHGAMTWDNMAEVLTYDTINELTDQMLLACRLSEIERGKSGPASIGGATAPNATPQAAA